MNLSSEKAKILQEFEKFFVAKDKLSEEGYQVETADDSGFILRPKNPPFNQPVGGRFDLLMTALIHGDEVIGLEGINLVLSRILSGEKIKLSVGFLLCNCEAAKRSQRFVETDLNRSFLLGQPSSLEQKRAVEIARIVERASLILDFHQTVEPSSSPFFIFEHRADLIQTARNLSTELPIVTFPAKGFSETGKTILEFATTKKIPALAIEWGQKGFSAEMARTVADFTIAAIQKIESGDAFKSPPTSSVRIYSFRHSIKKTLGSRLSPGVTNFMPVEKGQVIGHADAGPICAPSTGRIFFPKYGALAEISPALCEIGIESDFVFPS